MSQSSAGTSHAQFQALADLRLKEARALFAVGLFDGAWYLGGYAVECALKAVVTKSIAAQFLPPKGSTDKVYTHDLVDLMKLAGLMEKLKVDMVQRTGLAASWTVVNQWRETKRYESGMDQQSVANFLIAIDDANDGVLTWLKQKW